MSGVIKEIVSNLLIKSQGIQGSGLTQPSLSIDNDPVNVAVGALTTVVSKSVLDNLPLNYTVSNNSHTITVAGTVVNSSASSVTSTNQVTLQNIGDTLTITSSITLEHATDEDLVLTATKVIAAVDTLTFGFGPDINGYSEVGLSIQPETNVDFDVTTVDGRLYIGMGTSNSLSHVSIEGAIALMVSDFTLYTQGNRKVYKLNWHSLYNNAGIKKFKIYLV